MLWWAAASSLREYIPGVHPSVGRGDPGVAMARQGYTVVLGVHPSGCPTLVAAFCPARVSPYSTRRG